MIVPFSALIAMTRPLIVETTRMSTMPPIVGTFDTNTGVVSAMSINLICHAFVSCATLSRLISLGIVSQLNCKHSSAGFGSAGLTSRRSRSAGRSS